MLRGSFGWREAAVEAAIPDDAAGVVFGLTLGGRGAAYVAGPRLEIIDR
jgi:hypothetical protein